MEVSSSNCICIRFKWWEYIQPFLVDPVEANHKAKVNRRDTTCLFYFGFLGVVHLWSVTKLWCTQSISYTSTLTHGGTKSPGAMANRLRKRPKLSVTCKIDVGGGGGGMNLFMCEWMWQRVYGVLCADHSLLVALHIKHLPREMERTYRTRHKKVSSIANSPSRIPYPFSYGQLYTIHTQGQTRIFSNLFPKLLAFAFSLPPKKGGGGYISLCTKRMAPLTPPSAPPPMPTKMAI